MLSRFIVYLSTLSALPSILALKLINPHHGSTLNTSSALLLLWTHNSSDPSLLDFALSNINNTSAYSSTTLASNISTSKGNYIVSQPLFENAFNSISNGAPAEYEIIVNSAGSEGNLFLGESGTVDITNGTAASTSSGSPSASASTTSTSASAAASSSGAASGGLHRGMFAAIVAGLAAVVI